MTARVRSVKPPEGAPIIPVGDAMRLGLGPGAWADRPDVPDVTFDGHPKIRPLRSLPAFSLDPRDPDPRGMAVYGADGAAVGTVSDVWVDSSEPRMMYLEIALSGGASRVLMPAGYAQVDGRRRRIRTNAILGRHFAGVPATKSPDTISLLEEDMIAAYYAGGYLYATPDRAEPIV